MIQARLKNVFSPEVPDLEAFVPVDPDCFALNLVVGFGAVGSEGEEIFELTVCSPGWIAKRVEERGILDGATHLIVHPFNWEKVHSYLRGYATRCTGSSWGDVANKLCRIGRWEFENYTSSPG